MFRTYARPDQISKRFFCSPFRTQPLKFSIIEHIAWFVLSLIHACSFHVPDSRGCLCWVSKSWTTLPFPHVRTTPTSFLHLNSTYFPTTWRLRTRRGWWWYWWWCASGLNVVRIRKMKHVTLLKLHFDVKLHHYFGCYAVVIKLQVT